MYFKPNNKCIFVDYIQYKENISYYFYKKDNQRLKYTNKDGRT